MPFFYLLPLANLNFVKRITERAFAVGFSFSIQCFFDLFFEIWKEALSLHLLKYS